MAAVLADVDRATREGALLIGTSDLSRLIGRPTTVAHVLSSGQHQGQAAGEVVR